MVSIFVIYFHASSQYGSPFEFVKTASFFSFFFKFRPLGKKEMPGSFFQVLVFVILNLAIKG